MLYYVGINALNMNSDTLFSIANAWVLPGWLLIAFLPGWKYTSRLVYYVAIVPLAIAYSWLFLSGIGNMESDSFSTLDNVVALFSEPDAVLIGWIHYLAFDLLVGLMIANDARRLKINQWIVLLPLFFTFMSGPFGLLIYTVIRFISIKKAGVPLLTDRS